MTTTDVTKLISRTFAASDRLTDVLAGEDAFPLALLVDQLLFAINAVVAGDEGAIDIVEDLKAFAEKQIVETMKRMERD